MGAKRLLVIVAIGLLVLATATNAISTGKEDDEDNDNHDQPCQLVIRISIDGTVTVKHTGSCESFQKFGPGAKVDLGGFTGQQEGCAVLPTTGSPECVSYLYRGILHVACE